ncbi:hypothetical protein FACS189419_08960 [Planctomycetales bacterium]|nr:hypothetical protein FACS189419_08960 [Planctomycetales bacterium]
MKEYTAHSIYIAYPENWQLEENETETINGSLMLSNENGAFWLLKKYPFGTNPDRIAEEAVEAMQTEYENVEVERFDKSLFGKSIIGFEMTFFYLDLMNLATVLCFEQDGQTWTVFWQTGNQLILHNDETVPVEQVLEAITLSMLRGEPVEHKHCGQHCKCRTQHQNDAAY